jgi:GTP cyclohydrolase I
MMMRGVEKHSSATVTYGFKGKTEMEQGLKDLLK